MIISPSDYGRMTSTREESELIGAAALAMQKRIDLGGKLILFGNGGSAPTPMTGAIDCVLPPQGYRPIPAVSLSSICGYDEQR